MNETQSFFSLRSGRQHVNQWLCIAFLGLWCFWIVLYYATEKAQTVGDVFTAAADQALAP